MWSPNPPPLQKPQGRRTHGIEISNSTPRVQNLKFNFPSSARRGSLARYLLAEARVYLQRVALENLALILRAEPGNTVNVALRIVEVVPCLRIDALDRADHFRREQDVVGGNYFREQVDPGLVVDAGIEIDVVEQHFF